MGRFGRIAIAVSLAICACSSRSGGASSSAASSTGISSASSSASTNGASASSITGSASVTGSSGATSTAGATGGSVGTTTGSTTTTGASFALSVAANPNSALSAVGRLSFPLGVASAWVQIQTTSGADAGVTPARALTSSPTTVPILLLQASTAYQFTAIGALGDGGQLQSAPASFTTPALPSGVPFFTINDGGQASAGYTLVSNLEAVGVDPAATTLVPQTEQYIGAVDGSGRPVWYLTLPLGEPLTGDFERAPDGTYIAGVYDATQKPIIGLASNSTIYLQYDSLGNLLHTWKSPLGLIPDPGVDGGEVNIIAGDQHELVEVDDAGAALLLGITPLYPFNANILLDGGGCFPDGGPLYPGGPRCDATDFAYELEKVAQDGGILWDWNAADHIPPTHIDQAFLHQAYTPGGETIDGYHANSIDVMTDGTYLVSFRNMSQIVDIDPTTGALIWTLGGVGNEFTFVNDPVQPEPGPSFQHDVRQLPTTDGTLLIYMMDDGNFHTPRISRGVEYLVDTVHMTATMVWEAYGVPGFPGFALGSVQFLENGNSLLCFGVIPPPLSPPPPHIQELAPDGGLLWDLSDTIPFTFPDGGMVEYPDGGTKHRDFGFYRATRLSRVY